MRIVIAANDSRGGVQPYAALGRGLLLGGHEVTLLAPSDFAGLADVAGVGFSPLSGSVEAVARALGERGATAGRLAGLRGMRLAAREMEGRIATWTREARAAIEGADLVLGGIGGIAVARSAAEAAQVPFMEAHLQPLGAPTTRYPGPLFAAPPSWLGPVGRRLSHTATGLGVWMPLRGPMASARRTELGLHGRVRVTGVGPVLYGFSQHVVPVVADSRRPRIATGWWFLDDAGWTPPDGLEAFLAADGPVVSIGFGSMTAGGAAATTDLVVDAVRDAGVRAVFVTGWGALADTPAPEVFVVPSIPYAWLFQRVAAVVHHGGAGTTGDGLRAGVPNIVVPYGVDQPFWGSRVHAVGAGPVPIPQRSLTRPALAAALRQVLDDHSMRRAAARIGEAVRGEDGVATAVATIEAAFG